MFTNSHLESLINVSINISNCKTVSVIHNDPGSGSSSGPGLDPDSHPGSDIDSRPGSGHGLLLFVLQHCTLGVVVLSELQ